MGLDAAPFFLASRKNIFKYVTYAKQEEDPWVKGQLCLVQPHALENRHSCDLTYRQPSMILSHTKLTVELLPCSFTWS